MALLTKTIAQFVTAVENSNDHAGQLLIGLTFKPVASGNPTRFVAIFRDNDDGQYEVWDVGP